MAMVEKVAGKSMTMVEEVAGKSLEFPGECRWFSATDIKLSSIEMDEYRVLLGPNVFESQ